MFHLAVRVRELVSSNVDNMVARASEPAKLLHHLRTEIEEALISLHGDLAKAKRKRERLGERADAAAVAAEEWTAKAKTAMDAKREDLARSALLAREDGRMKAAELSREAETVDEQIAELGFAIAKLETKRDETIAKLGTTRVPTSDQTPGDSTVDSRLDRIERMARRIDYSTDGNAEPAPASIEAEIAKLSRDADLTKELAALKAATKRGKRKTG